MLFFFNLPVHILHKLLPPGAARLFVPSLSFGAALTPDRTQSRVSKKCLINSRLSCCLRDYSNEASASFLLRIYPSNISILARWWRLVSLCGTLQQLLPLPLLPFSLQHTIEDLVVCNPIPADLFAGKKKQPASAFCFFFSPSQSTLIHIFLSPISLCLFLSTLHPFTIFYTLSLLSYRVTELYFSFSLLQTPLAVAQI